MAQCKRCNREIAWGYRANPAPGQSPWEPREPERDEQGNVIKVLVKNGKGRDGGSRTVRRAKASATRHVCTSPSPTPLPAPKPIPAPPVPMPAPYHAPMPEPMPEPEPIRAEPEPVGLKDVEGFVRATMKAILDEYGVEPPVQRIEIKVNGKVGPVEDGVTHPMVPVLCGYVARSQHVYLHGPAGSGKTYGSQQAARMCGRKVTVVAMPGMTVPRLMGYADMRGQWIDTPFARAMKEGHVVVADEIDRILPSVGTVLNSVLENRVYAFGDAVIEAHPDFVLIGTGNTDMRGASPEYQGAQPLDYATAARFAFLEWGYDADTEDKLLRPLIGVGKANALTAWARATRQMLQEEQEVLVWCGPRETLRIAEELSHGTGIEDAVSRWVWRGLAETTRRRYLMAHPIPEALK